MVLRDMSDSIRYYFFILHVELLLKLRTRRLSVGLLALCLYANTARSIHMNLWL
jgi:hypothetical protein